MTETLAYEYSSKSTHRELSNEYQHDRVVMVFKNLCTLVLLTKVASAFEGLTPLCQETSVLCTFDISHNNLTLNARLTDQSAILIPCAKTTDEQVRKEIHRNRRPPPCWVTSINQEVIHRIRLSNLRIGDVSISPILICFSLSD